MAEYFNITIKELGPVIVQDTTVADRLLIIGPALDGPANKPIKITSQSQAEKVFGPLVFKGVYVDPSTLAVTNSYSFNELVRAYSEAIRGGARDVYLVRAGGKRATATGSSSLGGANGITAFSTNPGLQYNGITVVATVTGAVGTVTFNLPAVYGGSVSYSTASGTTIDEFISIVNSDNKVSNVVRLSRNSGASPYDPITSITGTATLVGGTYGTEAKGDDNYNGKFQLYQDLINTTSGTFDALQDFDFDLALLSGIYLDDQVVTGSAATTTSILDEFNKFIYGRSLKHPCLGFLGMRPLGFDSFDLDKISTHILNNWESTTAGYVDSALKWIKAGYFRNRGVVVTDPATQEVIDESSYINVVAGADIRLNTPGIGNYAANPVSMYAGLVSSLNSEQSPTRKILQGTLGVAFPIRESQIRRLVNGVGWDEVNKIYGKGSFVIVRPNENLSPEIAYGVTFANDRSQAFADIQPQRVAFEAIKLIKRELLPFIGSAFNAQIQMAMEERVRRILDKMVEAGKLIAGGENISYQFTLNASNPLQIANNEVQIDLILIPALEIKKIRVNATVRKQG